MILGIYYTRNVYPQSLNNSNSKMTPISYNYNTKYTTKLKHALALYDVAIDSTMNTCILLDTFKSVVSIWDWMA